MDESSVFYNSEEIYIAKGTTQRTESGQEKKKKKTGSWQDRMARLTIRSGKVESITNNSDKVLTIQSIRGEDRCTPILFRAVAVRDCVPSPYHKGALSFKTGDKIGVTMVREDGVWRGRCKGREGYFKFIDVKRLSPLLMRRINTIQRSKLPRSHSVSDLLSTISLENLTPVFVLNGYDTVNDFEDISDEDLNYLGITDAYIKDRILDTIAQLNTSDNNHNYAFRNRNNKNEKISSRDSGLSSSSESILSDHDIQSSPSESFLYQQINHSKAWRNSAVFVTEVTFL